MRAPSDTPEEPAFFMFCCFLPILLPRASINGADKELATG